MPALLILITVGLLIGTWISGGTIPMMIYYGLKAISPEYLYVTAYSLLLLFPFVLEPLGGQQGLLVWHLWELRLD